jgi:hypothetical protein
MSLPPPSPSSAELELKKKEVSPRLRCVTRNVSPDSCHQAELVQMKAEAKKLLEEFLSLQAEFVALVHA